MCEHFFVAVYGSVDCQRRELISSLCFSICLSVILWYWKSFERILRHLFWAKKYR